MKTLTLVDELLDGPLTYESVYLATSYNKLKLQILMLIRKYWAHTVLFCPIRNALSIA